jgi:ribosomal protein L11 methyltransferase
MMSNSWLEVSLVVDGELAEAVAEVLARFAVGGVVIESTGVTAGPDDSEGRAVGPLRVAGYLPVDEVSNVGSDGPPVLGLEERRERLMEALWFLGRIRPLPEASFRVVEEADWAEAWKVHFRPIAIGKGLEIVPAWLENPEAGRIAIRIDPGMAFGTGTHPTTQLCLEFIEDYFQSTGSMENMIEVIDVGCGSGILAIAALKLGARGALGVDLDAEAVRASRENGRLNEVEGRLELGLGSVREVRGGSFSLQKAGLVLANILAPVLVKLLEEGLGEVVLPGGWLVLSGILEEQCYTVEEAIEKAGLRLVGRKQVGDWVALCGEKVG